MSSDIIEEICQKAAALPVNRQREALVFLEELLNLEAKSVKSQQPFRSVRGILQIELENLDEDLADIRREMWRHFPREEPK